MLAQMNMTMKTLITEMSAEPFVDMTRNMISLERTERKEDLRCHGVLAIPCVQGLLCYRDDQVDQIHRAWG